MKCLTWILWKRTKSQPILFKFSHFNWPPWRVGQRLLYTALPQPVDSSSSSLSAGDPPKSLSELQPSPPAFLYEPKQNKYRHYIHTNKKKKKRKHIHLPIYLVGVKPTDQQCMWGRLHWVYPGQFLPVFLQLQLHLQRLPLSLDLQLVKVALVALLLHLQGQSLNRRVNTGSQNWHYQGWVLLELEDKHKSLLNIHYWTFYAASFVNVATNLCVFWVKYFWFIIIIKNCSSQNQALSPGAFGPKRHSRAEPWRRPSVSPCPQAVGPTLQWTQSSAAPLPNAAARRQENTVVLLKDKEGGPGEQKTSGDVCVVRK